MKLLWHPGIALYLLGFSRTDAARLGGPDIGRDAPEQGHLAQTNINGRGSSVASTQIAGTASLLSEGPPGERSAKSLVNGGTLSDHDVRSRSATDGNSRGLAKQRQRGLGSEEKEAGSHQHQISGLKDDNITPRWPGGEGASSALSAATPISSGWTGERTAPRKSTDVTMMRSPLASQHPLPNPLDNSVEMEEPATDALEEELLQVVVTTGFLGRFLEEERHRMLAVKLFEIRGRMFREVFGRFPPDSVIARFFTSAENGVLAAELEDFKTLKLFVYCLHLEAGDMTEGYLFSRKLVEDFSGRPHDFDAIMKMFSEAVRDGRLHILVEDEAERYLLYRFYVALRRKAREEGIQEDLALVDQYILSLLEAGILQEELETDDVRDYIVDKISRRIGVLNGAPLPPLRAPPPPPPTTESSTASPPKPNPPPKSSDPIPGSSAVPLESNTFLLSLLTIGVAAIFA